MMLLCQRHAGTLLGKRSALSGAFDRISNLSPSKPMMRSYCGHSAGPGPRIYEFGSLQLQIPVSIQQLGNHHGVILIHLGWKARPISSGEAPWGSGSVKRMKSCFESSMNLDIGVHFRGPRPKLRIGKTIYNRWQADGNGNEPRVLSRENS
jgi:hypothetical protein